MSKAVTEYPTFKTEGLTEVEIKFLAEVERLWFEGVQVSWEKLFLVAFGNLGYTNGCAEAEECVNAWKYWECLYKPIFRQSYKQPVKLSSLFAPASNGITLMTSEWYGSLKVKYIGEPLPIMEDESYYFQITNNNLYFIYNRLSGSRFVAVIENDLHFEKFL